MIVLDASAAVSMVRRTEEGKALVAMMELLEEDVVISCDLFRAEVRNAFWQYVRAGIMDYQGACDCSHDALQLVDGFVSIEELADEAFSEAVHYNHAIYDMLYLCLARRHGATLFTLDRRLAALCDETHVECVELVKLVRGKG